jgi:hypothetical protein
MEKYPNEKPKEGGKEGERGAFLEHSRLLGIDQAVELRDRFGITSPKLLAKALRISELRAIDIINGMKSESVRER